jgi:hypothetical protein
LVKLVTHVPDSETAATFLELVFRVFYLSPDARAKTSCVVAAQILLERKPDVAGAHLQMYAEMLHLVAVQLVLFHHQLRDEINEVMEYTFAIMRALIGLPALRPDIIELSNCMLAALADLGVLDKVRASIAEDVQAILEQCGEFSAGLLDPNDFYGRMYLQTLTGIISPDRIWARRPALTSLCDS